MAALSSPTRDRIVDQAMRLFGEQGYRGTSVAQIEAVAGLTPGAGGLYHHFSSKKEVLTAGIERHLARLDALRDIRQVFASLGDLQAELTVTARYVLAELDNEGELLRILASEARRRPQLLTGALERLISSTFSGFAQWLAGRAIRPMAKQEVDAVAAIGLGALLSSRLLRDVLGVVSFHVEDETLIATWVQMMLITLREPARG
jgi:AcrR family transcriptional regulator